MDSTANDLSTASLEARIEALRKRDFLIELPGAESEGAPVTYELIRHHFEFGTAISPQLLGIPVPGANATLPSAHDVAEYLEIVKRLFSAAVAANHMKGPSMEHEDGTPKEETALALYEWCRSHGLFVRGHCILWGVRRWQPDWLLARRGSELKKRVLRRISRVNEIFGGKIDEWDLNNEMMHEDFIGKALELKNGAPYFKWRKDWSPKEAAKRYERLVKEDWATQGTTSARDRAGGETGM